MSFQREVFLLLLVFSSKTFAHIKHEALEEAIQVHHGLPNYLDLEAFSKHLLTYGKNARNKWNVLSNETLKDADKDCLAALAGISEGVVERTDWAIQFADAQFKPPPGIKLGRLHFYGSYDECLAIDGTFSDPYIKCTNGKNCRIQGQYCSLTLNTDPTESGIIPLSFRLGVCTPKYCTKQMLDSILKTVTTNHSFSLDVLNCDSKNDDSLKGEQSAVISILAVISTFLAGGLILDLYQRWKQTTFNKWYWSALLSFSPYSNALKIFHTGKQSGSLDCLHGIRFLSMCWVILGHTYGFLNFPSMTNTIVMMDVMKNLAFQLVANATVSVDTFFFIGGLLVAYVTLRELNRSHGKLNWFIYVLHRFWRLTPAYALIMSLQFLWPLLGSGPQWKETTNSMTEACRESWYTALLYVNILIPNDALCMAHGWYLSNDMQFYLISPILLLLLYKYGKWGVVANVCVVFISCVTTWSILFSEKIPAPTISVHELLNTRNTYMKDVYMKPWCRIGPYCIGLIVGYLIVNHYDRIRNEYLSDVRILVAGWLTATFFALTSLLGLQPWNDISVPIASTDIQFAFSALFGATFRIAWTMSLAWIVLVCVHGYGGIVNRFLSWSPFIPLGRLTFCAYLIHPMIIYTETGLMRTNVTFSHYYVFDNGLTYAYGVISGVAVTQGTEGVLLVPYDVMRYFSYLVLSYMMAFLCTLAFEAPFIGMEKILFRSQQKPVKPETSESAS